ncbi:MAG: RNA polymerase sigma factor (sigma-70 family) [Planctomycetota bacterium]|jgi:RNA polymerase sigma factor (sigma-70 family)
MTGSPQTASLTELLSHSDWLRVLARKLVADDATAEDLVQETWLAAMKNPPTAGRPARPWLAEIARNLARFRHRTEDRLRRRQTVVAKAKKEELLPSSAELVEQVETERQLASVVLELDEPFRTIMLLHYFQDLSLADIASRQGTPPGTVRWRHARGLELVREHLNLKEDKNWCLALFALARANPPLEVSQPQAGGLSTGSSLIATTKVAAVAAAAGIALWVGMLSVNDEGIESGGLDALVVDSSGGRSRPNRGGVIGSSLADDTRRESDVQLDPKALLLEKPSEAAGVVAVAASLRVHLVDNATSGSTAGRRMVLLDEATECHVGLVDDDGWAIFEGVEGPAYVYVARPNGFAHVEPVTPGDLEMWIELDLGSELSGAAFLNGKKAPAGIELTLLRDGSAFRGRDWPDPVSNRIFAALGAGISAKTHTDAAGRFEFTGLLEHWSGVLYVPEAYELGAQHPPANSRYGGGEVRFVGPARKAEVYLQQSPRVTGRILDGQGDQPAVYAQISCEVTSTSGERFLRVGESRGTGEFEVQIPNVELQSVRLSYSRIGGQGYAELTTWPNGLPGLLEFGDLLLATTVAWPVLVVDRNGDPIEGAAIWGGDLGPESLKTNSEGRAELFLSTDNGQLIEVQAPSYLTAKIPRPEGDPSELQVTLGRGCSLSIELDLLKAVRTTGLHVLLETTDPSLRASSHYHSERDPRRMTWTLGLRRELVIDKLLPGQRMTLSVLGPTGVVLFSDVIEPLDPGAQINRTIALRDLYRKVHVSAQKRPNSMLSDVTFIFTQDGAEFLRGTSDRKGAFRQDFIPFDGGISVELAKRGFVSRHFAGEEMPGMARRAAIILKAGRDVRVKFADHKGQAWTPSTLTAFDSESGQGWPGRRSSSGEYVLLDVPLHRLELTFTRDGKKTVRQLGADTDLVLIED